MGIPMKTKRILAMFLLFFIMVIFIIFTASYTALTNDENNPANPTFISHNGSLWLVSKYGMQISEIESYCNKHGMRIPKEYEIKSFMIKYLQKKSNDNCTRFLYKENDNSYPSILTQYCKGGYTMNYTNYWHMTLGAVCLIDETKRPRVKHQIIYW